MNNHIKNDDVGISGLQVPGAVSGGDGQAGRQGGQVRLCALALAIGMITAGQVQAQEELEEIQVTGTRIQRSGMETPTPVTTVTISELGEMSPGQMIESLSQLPQFFNNQTPQTTGFPSSAGSNLNLRGAGANRTLVLLNGRRVPNGNRFGTANISSFPEGVISNVETVTGGASAAYGTDAVAGVVNFIMDTEFEGFTGHVQGGTSDREDGGNTEVGGTFGMDIGDRGHILVSGDYFKQNPIISLEALQKRPWFRQRALVTNPDPNGPTFITRDFVSQTNTSVGGIINQPNSALNKLEFINNGGQVSTQKLAFSGIGQLEGGCNCQAEPTRDQTWGMDADNSILNANRRDSAFVYADYDVSDNFNVYAQGMYGFARVKGPWFSTPILTGPWQQRIFSGNPFLPANVQATMDAEGLDSFLMGMTGDNQWGAAIGDPNNPLGTYTIEQDDSTYVGTLGFTSTLVDAGFFSDWNISGYAQYGRNNQVQRFENGIRMGRLPLAMDVVTDPATGSPACRAAVVNPGTFGDCVPVNLFGGVQNVSPEAASYLVDPEALIKTRSKQIFMEIVMDGEVHEGWGAGPVLVALGASHREDRIFQRKVDLEDEFVFLNGVNTGFRGLIPENLPNGMPGVRAGSVPAGFQGASNLAQVLFTGSFQTADTVLAGEFTVEEGFGEINVPLVANVPFFQQLDANAAYRYADYTGSGGISSWKGGLNWQINDDLRLRGTRSRDVRAASLRERFDATAGGASVRDPEMNNATIGTASRSGGNPNADPEKADTLTIGAVYQPSFLEGFSISVDWYDIDIGDALAQLNNQDVVDGCFQGAQDLCQFVIRDPITNVITRVDSLFINVSDQKLKGIDLETRYTTEITLLGGDESLSWRLFGNWVDENTRSLPGAAPDAPRDNIGLEQPEFRITTNIAYSNGPFRAFLQGRWLDGHTLNRNFVEGVTIDDNTVPSIFYTDLNLSYTMEVGGQEFGLFANVTNLFDRDPPQTPTTPGFTGGTAGPNASLYDTIGRRYVVGMNVRF
ncbi:MAG: TonB-dependent receptor [Pseudomonadales bacterium]|nr:TonB-dependent receptor [Pseudomonadales bacterium]